MRSIRSASLLLALVAFARPALAQDETLFRGGAGEIGFYVAPVLKLTEVADRGEVLGGLRAGILFGRRFGLGLAAYGSGGRRDRVYADGCPNCGGVYYHDSEEGLQYGGVELEYLWQPAKLVHATVSTLVGGGSLASEYPVAYLAPTAMPNYGPLPVPDAYYRGPRETFFVAEPAAHAELNIATHVRLGVGLGYRFTAGGPDYSALPSQARGATGTLTLRIGKL